jgi:hypothetical protein
VLNNLILVHHSVKFLSITDQDKNSSFEDDSCLGEIIFFPSTTREINDSIIPQQKPND